MSEQTSATKSPAGIISKCCIKTCDNMVSDGGLQCYDCRNGRYPETRTSYGAAENKYAVNASAGPVKKPGKSKHVPMPSEAEIRVAIKDWYRLKGAKVWDTEQNREDSRVDAGLSDLIVLWPGKPVRFVEVKRHDGRQRPAQKEFQEYVERGTGAVYLMPRSLQEVIDYEEMGF